jgi:hypothetical protein
MRVIEVEAEGRSERWIWWTVAGVAVGLTAGVLVAERYSGRKLSARGLWRRARGLARTAAGQWGPLAELAMEMKELWDERRAAPDHGAGLEHDDALDDADEYEEAEAGEDLGDVFDDEEVDLEDESPIGARVLEAFSHDPILAERAVEIEADDDGDVILHGRVRAAREVAHAVTIARGVPGVTRVRQRLAVRSRR